MNTLIAVVVITYIAVGLAVGLAFVLVGVMRVQSAPVTFGARILLLPGATALWPIVLTRWLRRPR